MTMPSSPAIWRRMSEMRRTSVPPEPRSTSGTRPKPMPSSRGSIGSSFITSSRGAVFGSALTAGRAAVAGWGMNASMPFLRSAQPMANRLPPTNRNGSLGSPGTAAKAMIAVPATSGALRWPRTWVASSVPRSVLDPERVTMMPEATEISSAGIWAARPSPTVSSE